MQTTTTQTIRAAVIDAVRAITPRHEYLRESCPWVYLRPEEFGAGAQCRRYTLEESVARPVWGQYSNGELYEYRLELRAAYVAVPLSVLADVITLDGVDLREAIDNLRDPTVAGLSDVTYAGAEPGRVDSDGAEVVHMFTIQYLQETGLH